MPANSRSWIFFPWLNPRTLYGWLIACGFAITCLAVMLPDELHQCSTGCAFFGFLFMVSHGIALAQDMTQSSAFPFALGSFLFFGGRAGGSAALMISVTRFKRLYWRAAFTLHGGKGAWLRAGAYALWAAQFFYAPASSGRRSAALFQAIQTDRRALLIWVIAELVCSAAVVVAICAEFMVRLTKERS